MVSYVYNFNSQNRDLKYNNKNHGKLSLSSPCLGSFFRIPILLFEINNNIFSFFSFFMSIAGQCGSYMAALLVTISVKHLKNVEHKS